MDLFNQTSGVAIDELKNWYQYFSDDDLMRIKKIQHALLERRKHTLIYPEHHNVLRIFKDLKPEDTKVIILGQDPYHDGNATGYAFACANNISPSLYKIIEAFQNSPQSLIDTEPNASLEYLVNQGVMLLNTILTVEPSAPLSHADIGWQNIMARFIRNFSLRNPNVIYMLWGTQAKKFKTAIYPRHNLILEYHHPAYSARQRLKWDCPHFEQANEYLKQQEKLIINWR